VAYKFKIGTKISGFRIKNLIKRKGKFVDFTTNNSLQKCLYLLNKVLQ